MNKQEIIQKFWERLTPGKNLVLSTSKDNDVTSRSVSTGLQNGKIHFLTSTTSNKYLQIQANPNVSLCLHDVYMKGTAKDVGDINSPENKEALDALKTVFSENIAMFSYIPTITMMEVVIKSGGFGMIKTGGVFVIDFEKNVAQELKLG